MSKQDIINQIQDFMADTLGIRPPINMNIKGPPHFLDDIDFADMIMQLEGGLNRQIPQKFDDWLSRQEKVSILEMAAQLKEVI